MEQYDALYMEAYNLGFITLPKCLCLFKKIGIKGINKLITKFIRIKDSQQKVSMIMQTKTRLRNIYLASKKISLWEHAKIVGLILTDHRAEYQDFYLRCNGKQLKEWIFDYGNGDFTAFCAFR